jgi:small subunit ribosomal protein S2
MFREAARYVAEKTAQGKIVLFLGTKRQAQEAIKEEAERCGMFYVNHRWLGGTLTNWVTLQKSIKRLKLLKSMVEDGRMAQFSKKEGARLERELKHLQQNFSGVENMATPPDVIFVIDPNSELIAVREARRMGIPVVAIVDTNCDPTVVDWVVPGNDDALRAIRLFTSKISDAVLTGRQSLEQAQIAEQKLASGESGEEGVEYVDTSAYEVYEKQEGDFVEGEPVADALAAEPPAEPAAEDSTAAVANEEHHSVSHTK